MKKIKITLSLSAIAYMMITLSSCEKIIPDYREKWVGTYECEEICYSWVVYHQPDTIYTPFDTIILPNTFVEKTIVYKTIVNVMAKNDSILEFLERRNEKHEAKVDVKGNFREFWNSNHCYMEGNFIRDSLYMTIVSGRGYGYYSESNYKGKKIKRKK